MSKRFVTPEYIVRSDYDVGLFSKKNFKKIKKATIFFKMYIGDRVFFAVVIDCGTL